jgi:hypothetical protein
MKKSIVALILVAAVVAVLWVFRPAGERTARPVEGLPWQIEALPDGGSRVFGLTLARSTLGEARNRLGADMQVAVIAATEETGSLEAYYGDFTAGVLTGKLVLVAAADRETVERLRSRAVKWEYMESATRRYTLNPDDLPLVWQAPIATITFIPSANLEEETVLARFGAPRERIRSSEQLEHFLYPDQGLDLALDGKGKEVLQYVAPREFARLREPLVRAASANTTKPLP